MSKSALATVLGTILLGILSWALLSIVSNTSRVTALEVEQAAMSAWLTRIESKLDRVLLNH